MKDRILKILQHERLTPSKFADTIGVQRSNISHILSERSKPSLDFLAKILTHYPQISGDWLITGRGSMLKGSVIPKGNTLFDQPTVNRSGIPESISGSGSDKAENTEIAISASSVTADTISNESVVDTEPSKTNEPTVTLPPMMTQLANLTGLEIEQIVVFYKNRTFVCYKPG